MIQDIKLCKDLGAYGVVIGALKGNTIDLDLTRKMVEAAKPMKITFHMAFDILMIKNLQLIIWLSLEVIEY